MRRRRPGACAACGYGAFSNSQMDCITCEDEGFEVVVLYESCTGVCVDAATRDYLANLRFESTWTAATCRPWYECDQEAPCDTDFRFHKKNDEHQRGVEPDRSWARVAAPPRGASRIIRGDRSRRRRGARAGSSEGMGRGDVVPCFGYRRYKHCGWVEELPAERCNVKDADQVYAFERCRAACGGCRKPCVDDDDWHKDGGAAPRGQTGSRRRHGYDVNRPRIGVAAPPRQRCGASLGSVSRRRRGQDVERPWNRGRGDACGQDVVRGPGPRHRGGRVAVRANRRVVARRIVRDSRGRGSTRRPTDEKKTCAWASRFINRCAVIGAGADGDRAHNNCRAACGTCDVAPTCAAATGRRLDAAAATGRRLAEEAGKVITIDCPPRPSGRRVRRPRLCVFGKTTPVVRREDDAGSPTPQK